MSLLNLTAGELIALFGTISAVLVTLYLLDRSRRKQVVATLRFWRHAESNTEIHQKRRIQQPWSLVLQLLGIALLLLAIAQLQWGDLIRNSRDHVVILDTSAWMGARTARGTLMDDARSAALAYVRSVPGADRILLVRADSLATPATPAESNHAAIESAIRASRPSSSALNLDQAIEFAVRAQARNGRKPGEIVYIGAGRVEGAEGVTVRLPQNLRVLPVAANLANAGIRKVGLRRSPAMADQWDVFVSTRNFSPSTRVVQLALQFGGAPVGSRTVSLQPNSDVESTFAFRTKAAGILEARLLDDDAFADDNRAILEVPAQRALRVVVYTDEPDLLRPVLASNPRITAQFASPASYQPKPDADAIILDRVAPPAPPALPSIWIEPPAGRAPVPVKATVSKVKLARWNRDHQLGQGLRTRDLELDTAQVFSPAATDIPIAETDRGAVILGRPETKTQPKLVALGFHPVRSAMKYELATPLLFANLLRWVRPEIFLNWELNGGAVGTVEADIGKGVAPENVRVIGEDGKSVPFTIHKDHLRFFAGAPGTIRVQLPDREIVHSLTLPEVGLTQWAVPANVKRGIPRFTAQGAPVKDLWPWLAIAGALILFLEWIIYGRGRSAARIARAPARARQKVLQRRAS